MLQNFYTGIRLIYLTFGLIFWSAVSLQAAENKNLTNSQFDLVSLKQTASSTLENDNLFRRLFGKSSNARTDGRSRSKRHSTSKHQKYSPPASNSQSPESQGSKPSIARTTDLGPVRNTPKPPLQQSRKDQSESLGIWELGFSFSTSHAITDMGGNKGYAFNEFAEYHTSNFSYGGGIYGRYLMNDWFAVRLGMSFANLFAERIEPFQSQGLNVYSFNNDIFEFYGNTEFRLPTLSRSPFDIYGFIGIGVFFSDASIYDQNDRLLSTRDEYNQVQPFIPFGAGFSVKLTNSLKLGYEFGWRNTIFQYLDGVKNDDTYDHYFLNSIKIGFIF